MPVITKSTHPLKYVALSLTLGLSCSLSSGVFAESHAERTVKAFGTLTAIVNKNYIDAPASRNQIMVAILAANPHAFKGGNINFMLRGVDLRLPTVDRIASISKVKANSLLAQHDRFFKRGRTGNLPIPNFANLSAGTNGSSLGATQQAQTEKLTSLEQEKQALNETVKRLEAEKAKRDNELKALEDKIKTLQSSSDSLSNTTADLKVKLENGELSGEGAALLEDLQERNESLNAQLQSARSEMAESTRMEISLERRMSDIQEENSRMAEALKSQGLSPTEILANSEQNITEVTGNGTQATTEKADTTTKQTTANSSATIDNSFMSNINWLLLLPFLGLLLLGGLLWKLLAGRKEPTHKRIQRSPTPAFVDPNKAIDPSAELEQEPPLEVSIKLDVARAYIESGNHEAAREMLNEVIQEGSKDQQLEAENIRAHLSQ